MNKLELNELRKANRSRKYAHFDKRTSMQNVKTWNKITNPHYVAKHAFYPFIYYEQTFKRFRHKQIAPKIRPICYSAHIDRCIYQLYAAELNKRYNAWAEKNDVNECAIAYRNNLKKTNIDFANMAIDYILKQENCYIIVGDFKQFFDNLDHHYLKQRLLELLEVNRLSNDYYAVFKSVTKYSYCKEADLLDFFEKPHTYKAWKEINENNPIMSTKEFHEFKKGKWKKQVEKINEDEEEKCVICNQLEKGIPQGSAISAVLANIYMMTFDCEVHNLVSKYQGLYMRYSDDFIIVLPNISQNEFVSLYNTITGELIQKVKNLILEKEKTQVYKFCKGVLNNIGRDTHFSAGGEYPKKKLEYLGFSFDGKIVRLRDKTISKYYYRMRKKAHGTFRWQYQKGRNQTKGLYRLYAITVPHSQRERQKKEGVQLSCLQKGLKKSGPKKGNFLTYVKNARQVIGKKLSENIIKRHLQKIKRVLNYTRTIPPG